MPLAALPSGLTAFAGEVGQTLASVRFDRPAMLVLLAFPACLSLLSLAVRHRQRAALAQLGTPAALRGLTTDPHPRRRVTRWFFPVAWSLLVLGAAGPRWGTGADDGIAVGRDVVLVLDFSRSMSADDCSSPSARWQSAIAGANNLIDTLQSRGGHRVAVVIYAGRPKLLVPLTTDTDHIRAKLRELDATHPPPEIRPGVNGPLSGTRFGAALQMAVESHDSRFLGSQDILFLSDGDDPADDREWEAGVSAARAAKIPVHTIGIGDPERPSSIFVDGLLLEFPGPGGVPTPVQTQLREDVLKAIASESRGVYLPARRDVPPLGEFFRTQIEPKPSRELTDDALPQRKDHSSGFLGIGLLLVLVAWWKAR